MKYLHVMHNDKFIPAFIDFINKNFDKKEHKFLIIDGVKDNREYQDENVVRYISKGRDFKGIIKKIFLILQIPVLYIKLFFYFKKSKKIILHGLFDPRVITFLYIFRNFLKKSYWIMWGGDLYSYINNSRNNFFFKLDSYVKTNMKGYITHIKGDYDLIKKRATIRGDFYYSFVYPSNLYKDIKLKKLEKKELWIQIGNSADSSNNHFEILEKLSKFRDMNMKLFCILSYGGNKEYINGVIKKGSEIFKEKFYPILEYMKFEEYMDFLSSLDIAIFAHNRQQGLGNVLSLLSMGKTVYLKETVTTYDTLIDMDLKINSFNKLEEVKILLDNELENNKKIIKEKFSEKELIKQLKYIFKN